jgi:homoserine dehydrogenase
VARPVSIGILGLGTVGTGLVELIKRNARLIEEKSDVALSVRRALVKEKAKARPLDEKLVTTVVDEVFNDPEISIVVELIGGIEPARTFILRALEAGKSVVTANKAVLAAHGDELFAAAAKNRRQIGFEASVCGGIPIIRALSGGMIANRIDMLCGILNGTTNYILTRMQEEGLPYAAALRQAQELGLAEADPTLDVKGIDTAHKLLILSELAFQTKASIDEILVEGIDHLDQEDIRTARDFDFVVKLVAVGRREGDRLDLRVHPALISNGHPLSSVRNEFNAVLVKGDATGEMIFYGKGAGSLPTASAVLSDIVEIARNPSSNGSWVPGRSAKLSPVEGESRYYLRFPIHDLPGVIGLITTALGNHQVSITHALATLVRDKNNYGNVKIVTHRTRESTIRKALTEIGRLPILTARPIAVRIFE